MIRRLTGAVIILILAPAVAWTQVVIEKLDEQEDVVKNAVKESETTTTSPKAEPTDTSDTSGGSGPTAEKTGGTADQAVAKSAFQIDRLDETAAAEPVADEATVEPISLGEAQEALRGAFERRLTKCLSATPRPREHRMAGSSDVAVDGTTAIVKTSKFTYNTDIHLVAEDLEEGADEEARRAKIEQGKVAMAECLAETNVELGGLSPAPTYSFAWKATWLNDEATLSDVEWK